MRKVEVPWRLGQIFWDTFLGNHIVLMQAIGICPIIAVGYRLQYGAALAASTAVVLLSTGLLMSLIGDRLPQWLRPPVYTMLGSLILWGCAWVLDSFFSTTVYAALYLYLPLMAVNALNYRTGGFAAGNRPASALVQAGGASLGFGVVICFVAGVRELLGFGTLWEYPLLSQPVLPQIDKPFFAFLMLALMAALLQGGKLSWNKWKRGQDDA